MTTLERTQTLIRLEADCLDAGCGELSRRMHAQLGVEHYSRGASIMPVPETLEAWRAEHRTARKRADRARRLGYEFAAIDRSFFTDDIYAINTSKAFRQGRPMSAGYTKRNVYGALIPYPCSRHLVFTYGILQGDRLRAYLTGYRVGDLCMVSMILGHGDHLANDIMYLLFAGLVEAQAGQGGSFYYNLHDSGTDGLRYYKERVGFAEGDIAWEL